MKLITVDDFLTWHNNAGGFLRGPVIVQLDNDPPNGRELSMYFFSCLEGGTKGGMYAYGNDVDFNKMIVVGFRPITVKDTGFFALFQLAYCPPGPSVLSQMEFPFCKG